VTDESSVNLWFEIDANQPALERIVPKLLPGQSDHVSVKPNQSGRNKNHHRVAPFFPTLRVYEYGNKAWGRTVEAERRAAVRERTVYRRVETGCVRFTEDRGLPVCLAPLLS
jgi:hypothetical protein